MKTESIITTVHNDVTKKFQNVVDMYNHKHNKVTNLVEQNWTTRTGHFQGNGAQEPFVAVEILYKGVAVYQAYNKVALDAKPKELKKAFEDLWHKFIDHSKTMAMIKFQHYYDQMHPVEPEPEQGGTNGEVKTKSGIILKP